jgi:conjugal transfer pilus assembly protein TraF
MFILHPGLSMSQFILIIFLFGIAVSVVAQDSSSSRWLNRNAEGWFWYKSQPELEEEVEKPLTPPPPLKQSQAIAPPPTGPAPLSSAWIRENMQSYLDQAIDNPTPGNIAAFLYIQRYAMDKSSIFMDATQEVTLGNSSFDESIRRPTATFANRKLDELATINNKSILDKISASAGMFLFLDPSDASLAQDEVVTMLERNHSFSVIRIAVAPLPQNFLNKDIKSDNGHSAQMGITSFPAIALIRPDGVFDVVSQAPVSYSDLQRRALIGAKRMNVISEYDFNSTRPVKNIQHAVVNLPIDQSNISEYTVPIPSDQIINAFGGDTK